jgi:hypothetical protein
MPNRSLDRSGGSEFRIKRDRAKVLGNAPPGQLRRSTARLFNMDVLPEDDQLILRVALATCFTYRLDADGTPFDDVRLYVNHLLDLYARHPDAATNSSSGLPQDMPAALEFCATQLQDVAPDEARRLRIALGQEA